MTLPDLRLVGEVAGLDRPVLLVAQAGHHVAELGPLADELAARNVPSVLAVPEPPRRPLARFRPAVRRHRLLLDALALTTPPTPAGPIVERIGALVVMNDWGVSTRSLVDLAGQRATPTYGWVEGVQDFADADVPHRRAPYRQVDHVLCLGSYDHGQLDGTVRTIVGSTRLRELWDRPPTVAADRTVVANCNFTYRVLEEHRRAWLRSVRRAVRAGGRPLTVSQHPADRAVLRPWERSRSAVDVLLGRSSRLVTRFSTLGYEALVRGVPVAYHNPHGERVPTFARPAGAFDVTTSTDQLAEVLQGPEPSGEEIRRRAGEFLGHHLRLDGPPPAAAAAEVIVERGR